MKKPQPIATMVIEGGGCPFWIYCSTTFAEKHIRKEAGKYGALHDETEDRKRFTLFVSPLYNAEEVKAFLLSEGR